MNPGKPPIRVVRTVPKVQVLGIHELTREIVDQADFVFSITDSPLVPVPFRPVPAKLLQMCYPNTDAPSAVEFERMRTCTVYALVTAERKGFTADDRLLVHCHTGIGRSAATAWAILVQMGYGIEDSLQVVKKGRSGIMPNRIVLEVADDHLGLRGELARAGALARAENERLLAQVGGTHE
jgi:hypothetical protein